DRRRRGFPVRIAVLARWAFDGEAMVQIFARCQRAHALLPRGSATAFCRVLDGREARPFPATWPWLASARVRRQRPRGGRAERAARRQGTFRGCGRIADRILL